MQTNRSIEQEILAKSLQEITATESGSVIGTFVFSKDFPAFEGHFPGQPVLPAVAQIAAVRLLAEKHLGMQLVPVKVDRAKFKNMIGPDEPVRVSVTLDQEEDNVSLSFTLTIGQRKASSGAISCRSVSR